MLARKGRTLITANRWGLVQAAAGVDGSNVGSTELALLPDDPDRSAARLPRGPTEQARRHRGSPDHRHHGPRLAQRTDRRTRRSVRRDCLCCTATREPWTVTATSCW